MFEQVTFERKDKTIFVHIKIKETTPLRRFRYFDK